MPDDKGLRGVVSEWRNRRAHTYASENADHYYGFEAGQQSAADELQPFLERLEAEHERCQEEDKKHADLIPNREFNDFEKWLMLCLERRTNHLGSILHGERSIGRRRPWIRD